MQRYNIRILSNDEICKIVIINICFLYLIALENVTNLLLQCYLNFVLMKGKERTIVLLLLCIQDGGEQLTTTPVKMIIRKKTSDDNSAIYETITEIYIMICCGLH